MQIPLNDLIRQVAQLYKNATTSFSIEYLLVNLTDIFATVITESVDGPQRE